MSHRHFPRRPPPWWSPDEPFPPASRTRAWHALRRRFFLRMGALFAFLFLLACGGIATFTWLTNNFLGRYPFGIAAVILIFVGLMITGRMLRRVTIPIGDMMEAAGRIADGDYTTRIAERGPREVRELAHAFNAMTTQLQAHDAQRRNLLADVSHELRTPLTIIQGNLEGLLDDVYPRDDAHIAPILDETRVLARLVDDLRTLALAESGALKLQIAPTDLAVLVNETLASFRASANTAGIHLIAEITPGVPMLELDAERIKQVIENLIANALRYTPREGTVRVSCAAANAQVTLAVSDTGAGIAPEALPHIFDRLYKSSDSRGAGLGLAIASSLVTAHGGKISAASELGHGTTIRLTLPSQ